MIRMTHLTGNVPGQLFAEPSRPRYLLDKSRSPWLAMMLGHDLLFSGALTGASGLSGALRGASGHDRDDDATLVSRRKFLQGTGAAGVVAAAPWLWPGAASAAASTGLTVLKQVPIAGAPPPEQLHLQFGEDAASQMSASWATPVRVNRPRLRLGRPGHGYGTEIDAIERVYTEALTGQTVYTHHAPMDGLEADSDYICQVHRRRPATRIVRDRAQTRDGRRTSGAFASA
jgi:Purple acid Phosphatase, N-terminal domain